MGRIRIDEKSCSFIYDKEKREEAINRFRESCEQLIEGYAKEGIFIKRVCLIDSNQIIPELKKCR